MPAITTCPENVVLSQLAAGQVPAADVDPLLQHLDNCPACQGRVRTLAPLDTLLETLGKIKQLPAGPDDTAVSRLMEKLVQLAKTAGPAMLSFTCPACSKSLKAKMELTGKKVKCPKCGQMVIATASHAATPSPASNDAATLPPETHRHATPPPTTGPNTNWEKAEAGNSADTPAEHPWDFLAPPQQSDEIGRLGPYRVLKVLGHGGMGVVFKAEDPGLERLVALKAMLPALAASGSAKQRFLREAKTAASIKHDHIVSIFQVGEDRGAPFLAMEFLDGESLDDRLKREVILPVPDVLRIGRQIAEGLAAAHERGLIHRDIKPGNIWLERSHKLPACELEQEAGKLAARRYDSRVKILDFGLARLMADQAHLTQSGAIIGTPAFMAPEQAIGKNVDHRCDLFSLGVVLYRMATGELPFGGTNTFAILTALAMETPKEPWLHNKEIPTELNDLIMRLLAKDPAQRHADAQAVVQELTALAVAAAASGGGQASSNPVAFKDPPRATAGSGGYGKRVLVAAGLLMTAAVAFGVYQLVFSTPDGNFHVKIDSREVEARFKDGTLQLLGPDGKVAYTLKPSERNKMLPLGPYKIQVAGADGLTVDTEEFTMKKGDKITVKVLLKAPDGGDTKIAGKSPATRAASPTWKPVPPGQSPLDKLDPKAIPESERFAWQPPELVAVIGEHRQRNWGGVMALSVRPNGKQVASRNDPGEQGRWEIPSGKQSWPGKILGYCVFLPVDKTILTQTGVWDIRDDKLTKIADWQPIGEFFSASRDGKLILAWGRDLGPTMVLLDSSDLKQVKIVATIADARPGCLSHDGKMVAAIKQDGVHILNWVGGKLLPSCELVGKEGQTAPRELNNPAIAFALDGRLGVCHADGVFRLWEISGKEAKVDANFAKWGGDFPVFAPDGKRVVLGQRGGDFVVLNVDRKKLEKSCESVPFGLVYSHLGAIAFLPDSNGIVTGHANGAVRFWDITEERAKEINPIKPGIGGLFEMTPDGKRLIAHKENQCLTQYEFGGPAPVENEFKDERGDRAGYAAISADASAAIGGTRYQRISEPPTQQTLPSLVYAANADGRVVYSARDGRFSLWDLSGLRPRQVTDWVEGPKTPSGYAYISHDGLNVILVGNSDTDTLITLWHRVDKNVTMTGEIKLPYLIHPLATFSPDGSIVAIGHAQNAPYFYAIRNAKLEPITSKVKAVGQGCFSGDGKYWASWQNGVRVSDFATGEVLHEWTFPGPVRRVLYAPDNRHLLVNGNNGVLYILRLPQS